MRALDLFCGAGGTAKGLQRAGFHVTGIDNRPQPRYCGDAFIQADALQSPVRLSDFDLIWASPPCQAYSVGSRRWGKDHPDLIAAVRARLVAAGIAFAIENVPGSPMRADIVLTGDMFGLGTYRRRHFETNFPCLYPPLGPRHGPKTNPAFCTVAGNGGDGPNRLDAWRKAMDIDWMTKEEIREAVPPAYAEFIGRWALRYLSPTAHLPPPGARPRRLVEPPLDPVAPAAERAPAAQKPGLHPPSTT